MKYILPVIAAFSFLNANAQAPDSWTQKEYLGNKITAPYFTNAVAVGVDTKGYIWGGSTDIWEYDLSTNSWTQKANFPGITRHGTTGFSIGNKCYFGTGETDIEDYLNDLWEYDPSINLWTRKADFGGAGRYGAVGFSIGTKGYLGGGTNYDFYPFYSDFWEYDPLTDEWKKKANLGGGGRIGAVGFGIGTKGYLGTGRKTYETLQSKDFWEYDPALDKWTRKMDFGGTPRSYAVGFSIGAKGYLGTGLTYYADSGNYVLHKGFWEYDPTINTWTRKADFGGAERYGAVGFSIGTKGFIGMGSIGQPLTDSMPPNDFWQFDPSANSWNQKESLENLSRLDAAGFAIGDKGYVGTGRISGIYGVYSQKDFWEYDPATNIWTQKADFGGGERYGLIAFSAGSKGYFAEGRKGNDTYNDFWEYDPALNSWARKKDFAGQPASGSVGFGIGNKGYVCETVNNGFWEYDPATDNWTRKANFAGNERVNATAFSIGNKGYIGLGHDIITNTDTKDFWEYNPINDKWTRKADFISLSVNIKGFSTLKKGYIYAYDPVQHAYIFVEYDPKNNNWIKRTSLGYREFETGIGIKDKGYIGFGNTYVNNNLVSSNDWWEYTPSPDNIITASLSVDTTCIGSSLTVSFTTTGVYYSDNVYTAHLSDSSGQFPSRIDKALNIGSVAGNAASGNINATIPANIPAGKNYHVRVVSSDPVIISNEKAIVIVPQTVFYRDIDGDGYGNAAATTKSCSHTPPSGYVINSTDCNDNMASVHPGASEVCGNGIDDNCDGRTDESCISVAPQPAAASEGNSGLTDMNFVVALSSPATQTCSVKYKTVQGTAIENTDYVKANGTLTFATGESSKIVTISVIGDITIEPNESFKLKIQNPVNLVIAKSTAPGTILNDDGNKFAAMNDLQLKESIRLVVPTFIHRNQQWVIQNLPATNTVVITNEQGQTVLKTNNYKNETSFSNLSQGVYFYNIYVKDRNNQTKVEKGKLVIVE